MSRASTVNATRSFLLLPTSRFEQLQSVQQKVRALVRRVRWARHHPRQFVCRALRHPALVHVVVALLRDGAVVRGRRFGTLALLLFATSRSIHHKFLSFLCFLTAHRHRAADAVLRLETQPIRIFGKITPGRYSVRVVISPGRVKMARANSRSRPH